MYSSVINRLNHFSRPRRSHRLVYVIHLIRIAYTLVILFSFSSSPWKFWFLPRYYVPVSTVSPFNNNREPDLYPTMISQWYRNAITYSVQFVTCTNNNTRETTFKFLNNNLNTLYFLLTCNSMNTVVARRWSVL